MTAAAAQHAFLMISEYAVVSGGSIERRPKAGPPPREDGITVGMHHLVEDSPHGGELHPDGDELLFVVAGDVSVVLHTDRPPAEHVTVRVPAGHAFVVPRDVWHRLIVHEASTLLHATPGPHFDVIRKAQS